MAQGTRGVSNGFLRTVSVLAVVCGLVWWGLPRWRDRAETTPGSPVLGVVDVGAVYERALSHMGGRSLGLNPAGDRGQQLGLKRLRNQALVPLLAQARHFLELNTGGIQTAQRAERERDRLAALENRGQRLVAEMSRLELAWFALATGTNWADLGRLSKAEVSARWDSLEAVDRGARADMRVSMGTAEIWPQLVAGQRQVAGMAKVLRLLDAPRWSPGWGPGLAAAADRLAPAQGPATRAYRNSAFLLVRLKRVEHQLPASGSMDTMTTAPWELPAIRSILPRLRREVELFPDENAPELARATVALYAELRSLAARRDTTAVAWQELRQNPAALFDPELYRVFLGWSRAHWVHD